MKKLLVASTIALSMSFATSSHALDPATAGTVAGGAITQMSASGTAVGSAIGGAIGGAVGSAVGAGVVAGVAVGVVGGAGAAGYGTAVLIEDKLLDGCQDKTACEKAKVGLYHGVTLGTGGVVGALAVAGADVAGLTAIGGAIGGGAIVGTGMLIAAPIVAAAALGGAAYWWYSD